MNMKAITFEQLKATNDVFIKLNNLRRWTDFSSTQRYNELSKQALNCIIAYAIACASEEEGRAVNYSAFPKIAIQRAFEKAYVYYDTPEHKIDEICSIGKIDRKLFSEATREIIAEEAGRDFEEYLTINVGKQERNIYKAATKIATYIEFLEQQKYAIDLKELSRFQEIERNLEKYKDIPGVIEFSDTDSGVFKVFQELSTLRNQNRWATFCYNVECSVLGHLFDTAVYAYLFALEEKNFDEGYATKMFFYGLFHDVAETWTKDIPSPIKDRIPGFRKATEKYEEEQLNKHILKKIPKFLKVSLEKEIAEYESKPEYKRRIKEADYISADSECCRNLLSGSRDPYFGKAIFKRKMNDDASDLYCKFHEYFVTIAAKEVM